MDYQAFFKSELQSLRDEGNYRVFADLERHRGEFPRATRRDGCPPLLYPRRLAQGGAQRSQQVFRFDRLA